MVNQWPCHPEHHLDLIYSGGTGVFAADGVLVLGTYTFRTMGYTDGKYRGTTSFRKCWGESCSDWKL